MPSGKIHVKRVYCFVLVYISVLLHYLSVLLSVLACMVCVTRNEERGGRGKGRDRFDDHGGNGGKLGDNAKSRQAMVLVVFIECS